MKRVLLCVLAVILFTLSAFGNATADLLKIIEDKHTTPKQVITLIKKGANVNAMKKGTGRESGIDWTVLQAAVMWNENPEVIKVLLKAGAYVDAKSTFFGDTALMWAIQYNTNPEIIKLLLNAGSDINIRNREGKDAITLAQKNTNPEIRNMFKILEFGGIKNALINAAQKNFSPSDFRNLIDAGADINATNQNGATVMMTAAANTSYPEVITILANAGADIHAKNSVFFGKTARDWAIQAGASQEVLKILEGL